MRELDKRGPILVTGTHRSGTTWLGRLLSLDKHLYYVQEPLNVTTRPSWMAHAADHWYQYLGEDDVRWADVDRVVRLRYPVTSGFADVKSLRSAASVVRRGVGAGVAAARGRRALVKDPFMAFNANLFQRRYGATTVFTVRHPAAFVDSLMRRDWAFDLNNLRVQSGLLGGPLAPWADDIRRVASAGDMVAQACTLWRCVNGYAHQQCLESPDSSIVVVYESLAKNVDARLPTLYRQLGLDFSPSVRESVGELTKSDRDESGTLAVNELRRNSHAAATAWRDRVSDKFVKRVEDLARPEFNLYYEDGAGL